MKNTADERREANSEHCRQIEFNGARVSEYGRNLPSLQYLCARVGFFTLKGMNSMCYNGRVS